MASMVVAGGLLLVVLFGNKHLLMINVCKLYAAMHYGEVTVRVNTHHFMTLKTYTLLLINHIHFNGYYN